MQATRRGVSRRLSPLGLACSVAATLWLVPALALAQHAGPPDGGADDDYGTASESTDELTSEGLELEKKGEWSEAYVKLKAARARTDNYKLNTNLAMAEMQLGKYADAATHLTQALRDFPHDTDLQKKQRADVEANLVAAKQHVVTLNVTVSEPGADVDVDGARVGRAPLPAPLFLEPGEHTVRATAPGFAGAAETIRRPAGSEQDVTLSLVPLAPVLPPPAKPSAVPADDAGAPTAPPFHPGLIAIPLVASAVGIGFGAGFHQRMLSIYGSEIDLERAIWTRTGPGPACSAAPPDVDCATLGQAAAAYDYNGTAGTVAFSAAAGSLLVGGALILIDARGGDVAGRPFHPALFALPVAVGSIALATAAGLHARSAALGRRIFTGGQDVLARSGIGGCADPANAAVCQAVADDQRAAEAAHGATLAMTVVGGAAVAATAALTGVYFARSRRGESAAATPSLQLVPTFARGEDGISVMGRW